MFVKSGIRFPYKTNPEGLSPLFSGTKDMFFSVSGTYLSFCLSLVFSKRMLSPFLGHFSPPSSLHIQVSDPHLGTWRNVLRFKAYVWAHLLDVSKFSAKRFYNLKTMFFQGLLYVLSDLFLSTLYCLEVLQIIASFKITCSNSFSCFVGGGHLLNNQVFIFIILY